MTKQVQGRGDMMMKTTRRHNLHSLISVALVCALHAEHCWRAPMHEWETRHGSPATAATPRFWIRLWRSGPRVTEIRRSRITRP